MFYIYWYVKFCNISNPPDKEKDFKTIHFNIAFLPKLSQSGLQVRLQFWVADMSPKEINQYPLVVLREQSMFEIIDNSVITE